MSRVSVATINIHHGAAQWLRRRHLLLGQLLDAAPDLIGLQEVALPIGQAHWLRRQMNYRLTGKAREPYQVVIKARSRFPKSYFEGLAILSKLPIIAHDHLTLINGRVALRVNVALPNGRPLDFVTTHLTHREQAHEDRVEQVMALIGWLNGSGAVAHQIIAGCFRARPSGPSIERMKTFHRYRSAYALKHGHEPPATFPTALVPTRERTGACYDYIFVSPAIKEVHAAKLICRQADSEDETLYPSDHVGVWAQVEAGR